MFDLDQAITSLTSACNFEYLESKSHIVAIYVSHLCPAKNVLTI